MKKPAWYVAEAAKLGQLILDGESTRTDALTLFVAQVRKHPEYVADLIATDADRELAAWLKVNADEEPATQLDLFPGLPHRMRVAPTRTADVPDMDAEQLDHARNMLWARTQNAIDGATAAAEHERKVFMAFYEKVRPLLKGDLTVSDVLEQLARAA